MHSSRGNNNWGSQVIWLRVKGQGEGVVGAKCKSCMAVCEVSTWKSWWNPLERLWTWTGWENNV